jgi:hypothetical protein
MTAIRRTVDSVTGADGIDGLRRIGASYADQLTDVDLQLLWAEGGRGGRRGQGDREDRGDQGHGGHGAGSPSRAAALLRHDPETIPALLDRPSVFDAIFGEQAVIAGRPLLVSPFLIFAVAVHRARHDLASMRHVTERIGLRQKVPVFDAPQLAEFLDSAPRRLFLAELLVSFTRSSGRYRVHTERGWRWRRLNELDPLRLAGLLTATAAEERPGIYRRLGDTVLFLAGVFPDYTQDRALSPVDAARLVRTAGIAADGDDPERMATAPAMELFEHLGACWYRNAWQTSRHRTRQLEVVADVAERFHQARRVLNLITDRYLFPLSANPGGAPAR